MSHKTNHEFMNMEAKVKEAELTEVKLDYQAAEKLNVSIGEETQGCGWFGLRPKCLDRFRSPQVLLLLLCAYFFANSAVVNGIFSTSISTIETRFSLTSSQMGMVTSIFDVAALIFIGPVSYFGVRNKPVMLGVGMITMGIGYVIFILPHLIAEKYLPAIGGAAITSNYSSPLTCASQNSRAPGTACSSNEDSNLFYGLFAIGMFVAGAGCAPMMSLGIPFMDESASIEDAPLYVGIFQSSGILAAVAGFLLSSVFLKIFIHPNESVSITPKSSSWIGAWWLGFAIGAAFALIIGILLTALPKKLPKKEDTSKESQMDKKSDEHEKFHPSWKQLPAIMKSLVLENPTFVLISAAMSLQFMIISSATAFNPKIAVFQFRLTVSEVSVYNGLSSGVGAILGNLAGSFFIKRQNLSSLGVMKTATVVSFCNVIFIVYAFIYCDTYPSPGINTKFAGMQGISLASKCNSNCSCPDGLFVPICAEGFTYVNPCYAGCTSQTGPSSFSNCSCIPNYTSTNGKANVGICKSSCGSLAAIYFIIAWFGSFSIFFMATPATMATLRCVPINLRSFAMGLQWMLVRVLGTIPGPILFGYVIDKSCIFWAKTCKGAKSCRMYNNKQLATSTGALMFALSALVAIIMLCTYFTFKKKIENEKLNNENEIENGGNAINTKL